MKFGLTDAQYDLILKTAVEPLRASGAQVWCYGSRARGDFKKFSDLDLMIESSQDLSSQISAVRERLEASNFPYKVDIVALSEFAQSYRDGYERDKVLF